MASLGYVRNNPWVQQDRMRILHHDPGPKPPVPSKDSLLMKNQPNLGNHASCNGNTSYSSNNYSNNNNHTYSNGNHRIPGDPMNNNYRDPESDNDDDVTMESEHNSVKDFDYGPGIVSRLRQKFLQLAQEAKSEAESEQEAFKQRHKSRRCASVDDLLDARPEPVPRVQPTTPQPAARPSRDKVKGPKGPRAQGLQSRSYSQSSSSLNTGFSYASSKFEPESTPSPDKKLVPEFLRSPPAEPVRKLEEFSPSETLANLRSRFEQDSPEKSLKKSVKKTSAESFLTTKSVANLEKNSEFSQENGHVLDTENSREEPEFLKISRKLRKVESEDRTPKQEQKPESLNTEFRFASGNPPDPDIRSSPFTPSVFSVNNSRQNSGHEDLKLQDRSPPPEEPVPPPLEPPPALPPAFCKGGNQQSDSGSSILTDDDSIKSELGSIKSDLSGDNGRKSDLMGFSSENSTEEPRIDLISPGPLMRSKNVEKENVSEKERPAESDSSANSKDSFNELQQLLSKFGQKRSEKRMGLLFEDRDDLTEQPMQVSTTSHVAKDILSDLLEPEDNKENGFRESLLEQSYKNHPLIQEEAGKFVEEIGAALIDLDMEPPQSRAHAISHPHGSIFGQENVIYEPCITLEPLSAANPLLHQSLSNQSSDSDASDRGDNRFEMDLFQRDQGQMSDPLKLLDSGLVEAREEVVVMSKDPDFGIVMQQEEMGEWGGNIPLEFGHASIAGDGNPISHSFISLISPEDLPDLLEPDNEQVQFLFEGEFGLVPGKSNLTDTSRRASKGGLDFHPETVHTRAYTYLEEEAALITESWEPGVELSHTQYIDLKNQINNAFLAKRIAQVEQELRARATGQGLINTPERKSDGGLVSFVPSQLTTEEYQLGGGPNLTWDTQQGGSEGSRGSLGDPHGSNGNSSSDETVNPEVRPDSDGNSFSKVESEAADLLF